MRKISKKYGEVLDEWLKERKESVKESTYQVYYTIINDVIKDELGSKTLKKIKLKDIEDFFESEKILNLSDSRKKTILIIIKSSINYSIEKRYIKYFDKIEIKIKKTKGKIAYFTLKEQETLDNHLKSNINIRNLGILVPLYTGIRIGELCGLKKKDIDILNGTISIERTVQRVKNFDKTSPKKTKLIVTKPKTECSNRTIPIPDFLLDLLKLFINDISKDDYYVFTNSSVPKDPRSFEKYFKKLLEKLKIRTLNFHSLRHTYATRLREQKVDIKVISELLGHSSWKITQEIYVHASFEHKKDSINELNNLWTSKKFVEQV